MDVAEMQFLREYEDLCRKHGYVIRARPGVWIFVAEAGPGEIERHIEEVKDGTEAD